MIYLLLLIPVALLAWRAGLGLRRLWRAVPNGNRDFIFPE